MPPHIVHRHGFAFELAFPSNAWRLRRDGEPRAGEQLKPRQSNTNEAVPIREAKASLAGFCPGDSVDIDVSLSVSQAGSSARKRRSTPLLRPYVAFEHLSSWRGLGRAAVECVAGCVCSPSVLEGHVADGDEERASLRSLHVVEVSSLLRCIVRLTVLNTSASGEPHSFSLMAPAPF
jgi:hypothetical protein